MNYPSIKMDEVGMNITVLFELMDPRSIDVEIIRYYVWLIF